MLCLQVFQAREGGKAMTVRVFGCNHIAIEVDDIEKAVEVYNDVFKIHKVKKTEGYHAWHYERAGKHVDRVMAYMTYLEVPQKGGETEFLHQSLRIDPFVGRTLIWPGGFTLMHRGNPPLEGEKIYITGWFKTDRDDE